MGSLESRPPVNDVCRFGGMPYSVALQEDEKNDFQRRCVVSALAMADRTAVRLASWYRPAVREGN